MSKKLKINSTEKQKKNADSEKQLINHKIFKKNVDLTPKRKI